MSDTLLMKYAKGIPKDLWYIFLPGTVEGLVKLEANLLQKAIDKSGREAAKRLRLQYNFPIGYCRYSLARMKIAVKLLELKEKKKWKDTADNGSDTV